MAGLSLAAVGGLSALGGLLALDQVSLGQTMISRPLVVATLTGFLLGRPWDGFVLGLLLECLYLPLVYIGGARVPDAAPATLAATAAAVEIGGAPGLAMGLVAGLILGELGASSVGLLRRWAGQRVPCDPSQLKSPAQLTRVHASIAGVDFARGTLLTALGLGLVPVWVWIARDWPLAPAPTLGVLSLGAAVGLGSLWQGVRGRGDLLWVLGSGLFAALWVGLR